jgi:hypothetical protein
VVPVESNCNADHSVLGSVRRFGMGIRLGGSVYLLIFALGVAALLTKHITLFAVWAVYVHVFGFWRGAVLMGAAMLLVALSFLPFLPDGLHGIVNNVIRYSSYANNVGLQNILPRGVQSVLMYAMLLAVPLIIRKRSLVDKLQVSSLLYVVLAPGMAVTHVIQVLIFWSLAPSKWLVILSAMISVTILVRVSSTFEATSLPMNIVWALCAWKLFEWGKAQSRADK